MRFGVFNTGTAILPFFDFIKNLMLDLCWKIILFYLNDNHQTVQLFFDHILMIFRLIVQQKQVGICL